MRALGLILLLLAPAASAAFAVIPADTVPVTSQTDSATVYPTWPVLTAEVRSFAAEHKDIVRLHSAGQSARGLDLWLVEIADFENAERVPLESREVLWIDGGTHANEYSGVMFVVHLMRWLARGYGENETATWIVENRHTWIMPLLNPEGSMNGIGRLNDNLVNINRNYPVGWGDVEEDPLLNNRGPYPGSEPETRAVMDWWTRLQPDYVASIHCCGNLWLYPYGIEGRDPHPDDAPVLSRICDEAYADVRESCGPVWSTIYPAGGSSADAAYELTGAASFGFEMSGREALALWGQPFTTSDITETEYESWRGVLHAFENVERYGAHLALTVLAVDAQGVLFRAENDGWGNLTRGAIRLTDATGAIAETSVPWLAPGQSADVRVPGTMAAGSFLVETTWVKRALGGEGAGRSVLEVTGSAGALAGSLAGQTPGVAPATGTAAIPTAGALLAALALAAVGLLRRR